MKISVVIPCFNAARHLARSVGSIQRQGIPDTEIIVVDDVSTDNTLEVARELAGKVPNLQVITQPENGGPARARNAGLRRVRGEYVCFLDADDAYSDGVFEKVLSSLDSLPWIQAIEFPLRLVNNHREVHPLQLEVMANSVPSNMILRTRLAKNIGGFPEDPAFRTKLAGEDIAFRSAIRQWGNMARMPGVFLEYTISRGSHFDRFMDRCRIENERLVIGPDEHEARVREGHAEYLRQVFHRVRENAGIRATRKVAIDTERGRLVVETLDNSVSHEHALATLQGKTYPHVPFVRKVERILDIGANIGAAAVYFSLLYPDARIAALEPSSQAFTLLRCNAQLRRNIETFNVGLLDVTESRELFLGGPDSVTNSLFQNVLSGPSREQVQLVSAAVFSAHAQLGTPDIIKIDTEGAELAIIRSMQRAFCEAKLVYLEYHSEQDRLEIDQILAPTHILFSAKVPQPHRGEMVYVRKDAFPAAQARDHWQIKRNAS